MQYQRHPLQILLLLFTLLATVVGQGFVYASSTCSMAVDSTGHMVSSTKADNDTLHMKHAGHVMDDAVVNDQVMDNAAMGKTAHATMDCCDQQGPCWMSGCVSGVLPPVFPLVLGTDTAVERVDFLPTHFHSVPPSSLFRPPIS